MPLIAFTFTANKLRKKHTIGFKIKAILTLTIVLGIIINPKLLERDSYILHVTF